MAVLPKERLGEVVPISFGDTNRSTPETRAWVVGGGGTAPDGGDVNHSHPQATAAEQQPRAHVEVSEPISQPAEPPVFEIPEDILRAFYEQAVQTGLEDGKSQVFSELNILQERYAAAIEQLRSAGQQLAGQNQTQIIQLACLISEKIVRSHLKLNPADLLSMVQEAIGKQTDVGTITVLCSGGDYEFLESRLDELVDSKGGLLTINLTLDESLEYGDFRIETQTGNIDGRVADRVNQVAQMIGGAEHA